MAAELAKSLAYLLYSPHLPTPLTRQALAVALRRLRNSANQGDNAAQVAMGALRSAGIVLRPNDRAAVRWYERAIAQGNTDAMTLAAVAYLAQGDTTRGHDLLCSGVARGSSYAMCVLGRMHLRGEGVDKDEVVALDHYSKAAHLGNPIAEAALAYFYGRGIGVQVDMAIALKWYARAARHGHAKAQHALAKRYLARARSKRHYVLAYAWALRSAVGGFVSAGEMVRAIRPLLTDEEHRCAEDHCRRSR